MNMVEQETGRKQITENEFLVIERILPKVTRGGRGKECWIAETHIEDTMQQITIWYEDRIKFRDAGYDMKALFESRNPVNVSIVIMPVKKSDGKWHIGSVEPKEKPIAESAVTVLSNEERIKQWMADIDTFGKPQILSITATFYHPEHGAASWWKNKEGTYTRQSGDDIRMYVSKAVQS